MKKAASRGGLASCKADLEAEVLEQGRCHARDELSRAHNNDHPDDDFVGALRHFMADEVLGGEVGDLLVQRVELDLNPREALAHVSHVDFKGFHSGFHIPIIRRFRSIAQKGDF